MKNELYGFWSMGLQKGVTTTNLGIYEGNLDDIALSLGSSDLDGTLKCRKFEIKRIENNFHSHVRISMDNHTEDIEFINKALEGGNRIVIKDVFGNATLYNDKHELYQKNIQHALRGLNEEEKVLLWDILSKELNPEHVEN